MLCHVKVSLPKLGCCDYLEKGNFLGECGKNLQTLKWVQTRKKQLSYVPQILVDPIKVELGEAHSLEIRANRIVYATIQL